MIEYDYNDFYEYIHLDSLISLVESFYFFIMYLHDMSESTCNA